jgi:Tfp pilus assembly protein PilP
MKPILFMRFVVLGTLMAVAISPSSSFAEKKSMEPNVIYSPVGKRDPFKPPSSVQLGRDIASVNPLERFSVEQLQLRGILRGGGKARAMFEDPEGKTHILGEGESIGREHGTVSRILNSEVIVTEKTFNYLGAENLYEKVISLPQK